MRYIGPLETQVKKLMDDIVGGSKPMLENAVGEKAGDEPFGPNEMLEVFAAQFRALKAGVQFVASEIDKARDA
jgi:hypothetical protein